MEDYGQTEDYDEYEEGSSQGEEDEEEVDLQPTPEELEFLKLREKLKEQIKKKNSEKETATTFGNNKNQPQHKKVVKDSFGSFFGPSKPSISKRVLEQNRAIKQAHHARSAGQSSSSINKSSLASKSSDAGADGNYQKPVPVNDIKAKVQALKDLRDYSFLLSDDCGPSVSTGEQFAVPNPSLSKSDNQSSHASSKSKMQTNKPALASNGHIAKGSVSANQLKQSRAGSANGVPVVRPKIASADSMKKKPGVSLANGRVHPPVHKALPSRSNLVTSANKATMKVTRDFSTEKKPSMLKPHSFSQDKYKTESKASIKPHQSTQKRYPEPKNILHGQAKVKPAVKPPLTSSKPQPPKKMAPNNEVRLKKRPVQRDYEDDDSDDDDDDGKDARMEIRRMFNYDPTKYRNSKYDDDRDMEVGYKTIMQEERRSTRIGKKEDEEELRRIEEEEAREKKAKLMRKKQRMMQ